MLRHPEAYVKQPYIQDRHELFYCVHILYPFFRIVRSDMLRTPPRLLFRSFPLRTLHSPPPRRLLSTAPPLQKSRSWKSSATRWGIALGAIYYYNNSDIFAEEPPCLFFLPIQPTFVSDPFGLADYTSLTFSRASCP